jgi:nicotinamidase-related amidase
MVGLLAGTPASICLRARLQDRTTVCMACSAFFVISRICRSVVSISLSGVALVSSFASSCTAANSPRILPRSSRAQWARSGMLVAYTLPGGGTIVDPSIAPHDGEVVKPGGGPDKFLGSDLDQRLKDHGIKTVILCGTSAQGVGLGTGAAAAQRGYYVVYPVDCLPSESAFREAYAAWHMAGGGPPVTTKWVTLTRSDMIKF